MDAILLWAQFAEISKVLPAGAATTAVIVVVYLFLRQQDKFNLIMKETVAAFNIEIAANQKAYQDQLTSMTGQFFANQANFQGQIQKLMDARIAETRETIISYQELKVMMDQSMREIRERYLKTH